MREELKKLLKNSKSLYYHFPVASILVTDDGTMFCGVNVECSSQGSGCCAERNSLYSAISNGYNKFTHLYLMCEKGDLIYPCFICRQALLDYCDKDMPITIYYDGGEKTITLSSLVPYAFSGDDLK